MMGIHHVFFLTHFRTTQLHEDFLVQSTSLQLQPPLCDGFCLPEHDKSIAAPIHDRKRWGTKS